jgi:hypothetical protein
LTSSEQNFDENAINNKNISALLRGLESPLSIISPGLSIVAAIGAAIVPAVAGLLKGERYRVAIEAREELEKVLRREFGVWISKDKILGDQLQATIVEEKKSKKKPTRFVRVRRVVTRYLPRKPRVRRDQRVEEGDG